jgi:putative endopeptidase
MERSYKNSNPDANDVIPETSKFSVGNMDTSVDPNTDFYRYANGKWLDANPVPADKTSWGTFNELYDRNNYMLRLIAEECSTGSYPDSDKVHKMVGDFYKSAMNTDIIESSGIKPINEMMEKIRNIRTKEELVETIPYLHMRGIFPFFRSSSRGDKKNSSIYAFYFMQGGLSLPNRDYYIRESFSSILSEFPVHIEKMLVLAGFDKDISKSSSHQVVEIEKKLAQFSRSQEELRDQEKNYNRYENEDLYSKFREIGLKDYMKTMGIPEVSYAVVGQPEFLNSLCDLISSTPLDNLKAYMEWNLLNFASPFLSDKFSDEHFDFFNRKIMGQEKQEPRWKRSVIVMNTCIGEALGKIYVEKHFTEDARNRMEVLVEDIKSVFRERLKNITWMSEETRKKAMEKFERFRAKIGHPETFRDYSALEIRDNDYFGNVSRSIEFEIRRQNLRTGLAVDRNEWFMTPPTVNAYFSPTDNEIVFPAGILQPPFFDVEMDDAVNYGAIGAVISHEITHGYDDQGSTFDENGNLKNWWTEEDKKKFTMKAQAVIDLYSAQEVLPGVKVHGERTVGENIADFGGVSIAYGAMERRLKLNPHLRKNIDGLTPEQRFFISWAQIWRGNIRDEELKRRVIIDPHAPNSLRASLPVWNHPRFEETFQVPENPMNEKNREKIALW